MSSSGTIRATMPLLPCRPAILSPTEIFRFSAMYTFTSWMTPGGSSSGWRILSIWSSAFSSTLARSRAAMSMAGRIRSLAALLATRSVLRSTSARSRSCSCGRAQLGAGREVLLHGAGLEHQRHFLPGEQVGELVEHDGADARLLVVLDPAHLTDPLAPVLLDDLILDAAEDLDVDDHARHAGRHLERAVLHVLGLLAEDGRQQLLFRRQLGLALGRDLADQDVARLHVGADPHDAALVEVHHALVGDVGDFPGDLLLAPLGVADVQLELLDVDRRVDVVLDQPLAEHDGVFEVVPVPRHERHQHVAAQRQLAAFGRRAVGDDLAGRHLLAQLDQRPLVDGGVLVGAPELLHPVAVVLVQPGQRRRRPPCRRWRRRPR